jgi:hypothetical protein
VGLWWEACAVAHRPSLPNPLPRVASPRVLRVCFVVVYGCAHMHLCLSMPCSAADVFLRSGVACLHAPWKPVFHLTPALCAWPPYVEPLPEHPAHVIKAP